MLARRMIYMCIIFFTTLFLMQCSLHPSINSSEAYTTIKPKAPLPEYEKSGVPVNVEVTIKNVADMNNSYKNTIDLYVNKYIIKPENVFNYKSDYTFQLRLQPGIYDIKAVYHAHTGWQKKNFKISTREPVKVFLDKKLDLSLTLNKNHWGAPRDKKTYFDMSYEKLN